MEENLFRFATKELSQDAITAWIFNSNKGTELLEDMCGVSLKIDKVKLQEKNIDILVEAIDGNKRIAVIIEDKTDTYLHSFQHLKYIEKLVKCKKYDKIIFVLFKTGDIYSWEDDDYKKWQKIINEDKTNKITVSDTSKKINDVTVTLENLEEDIDYNDNDIVIRDIYTLEKFKNLISRIKENINLNKEILEYYLSYLKELKQNNNCGEKFYKMITETLSPRSCDIQIFKPFGGGKRNYEFWITSEKLICNDKKFIILPHIEYMEDQLVFKINCQYIAEKEKTHGYVPYKKLTKAQQDEFKEIKGKLVDKDIIKNNGKENFAESGRLQFFCERYSVNDVNQNKVLEFVEKAENIAEGLKNSI